MRDGSDVAIAMNYVPAGRRDAVAALWALDAALGDVVRRAREPMVAQMRLTWWHARLCALDDGEALAEPVLAGLAAHVLSHDVNGTALAEMIEGWEALLDPLPLPDDDLVRFASARGGQLFAMTAQLLEGSIDREAGHRWALVDLACHASPALSAQAHALARTLHPAPGGPKMLRVLSRIAAARLRRKPEDMAAPLGRMEGLRAVFG